jgi:parvulin-like peptidyl-prolyl isomerase
VEADKELDVLRKNAHGEEALAGQLKAVNMTVADLHARLLDEAILAQVLRDRVTVTDEEVKKYYIDHPDEFDEPEKAHIHHLLLATTDTNGVPIPADEKKAKLQLAQDLDKRAHNGEDFNKLVKDYSNDPAAKDTAGELTFPRGTRRVPLEFEAAAFSLTPNQISDVVTSSLGYHIIKLDDKIPSHKLEYDKVKGELRNFLEVRAVQKMMPDLKAKLRKDADVQIVDDQVKTLIAKADELIQAQALKEATPIAPPSRGTNDVEKKD